MNYWIESTKNHVCTRVKFNFSIPVQFVLIEPGSMFHIYCQSLVRNKFYLWWGFRGVRPMKRRASIRKTEIRAHNMYKHTGCPKKSEFYWSPKVQTKVECSGCWAMDMTRECFIQLYVDKVLVRNDHTNSEDRFLQVWLRLPVERGVGYWWLSGCTVAPAAFS